MKFREFIKRIFEAGYSRIAKLNTRLFISFLRYKGIQIGRNFIIRSNGPLSNILIDYSRPSLITIGDNVTINKNFNLLTHDFVCGVFLHKFHDFLPSSGRVTIGNNVRFGVDCTVLKGVTIVDNCFIAAGSLVTKDIPANSVAGGVPCKVIMSIEDYYERRKEECIKEALEYARSIKERFGRRPVISDFWEEFPLFLNGDETSSELPIKWQLKDSYSYYRNHHKATFDGFEDFLRNAGL